MSEVKIDNNFQGWSGARLHYAIANTQANNSQLIKAYIACNAKAAQVEIFASPLEFPSSQRTILPGVNLVDLAIQGYFSDRPKEVKAHFDYIFEMSNSRVKGALPKLESTNLEDLPSKIALLLKAIKTLRFDESNEAEEKVNQLEVDFAITVELRILESTGNRLKYSSPLPVSGCVAWLSNYWHY